MGKKKLYYQAIYAALTEEEKDILIKAIDERNCLNCTNLSCKVPSYEKFSIDEDNEICGHNCLGWNNEEMIVEQKQKSIKR